MKLKNLYVKVFFRKDDDDNGYVEYKIDLPSTEYWTNEGIYNQIPRIIAVKIADEMFPQIKDKFLSKDGMTKLLNEIRLVVAKKFLQD